MVIRTPGGGSERSERRVGIEEEREGETVSGLSRRDATDYGVVVSFVCFSRRYEI